MRRLRWALLLLATALAACAATQRGAAPAATPLLRQAGDLRVTLAVDRMEPGQRQLTLTLRDAAGAPVEARRVALQVSMIGMDMGQTLAVADPVGPGAFQASGTFFSMVGRWQVSATIERSAAAPVTVAFELPIAAPGEQAGPLQPLADGPATREAGRLLYGANCQSCHGESGRGDGPAAAGLATKPADLTRHLQPGLHTDGQVFLWIRDGYPNTPMPAWGKQLSEEQIWQLVIYLRVLAAESAAAQAAAPLPPLVFARDGAIWHSDGASQPRKLPQPEGSSAFSPVVAPDGRRVAFAAAFPPAPGAGLPLPTSALYLADLDGSNLQALWQPSQGLIGRLAWAPDGASLYVGISGLRAAPAGIGGAQLPEIVRVGVPGGAMTSLLEDAKDPAVAPDGTSLAYLRTGDSGPDGQAQVLALEISSADGAQVRQLADGSQFMGLAAPRFSPDGRQIIFAAAGGAEPAPSGSAGGLLGLLEPPAAEAHGQPWNLWVVGVDGSGLRRLAQLDEDEPAAVFTPDGREIIALGGGGMYRMPADGSRPRRIGAGGYGGLDWAGR